MARGRLISRTIGSSRKFSALGSAAGELGEFAQALYPMLVVHADDFGRLSGDAFTVKHAVFPTSPRQEFGFESALGAMARVGLIARYDAGGLQVIEIVDFDEHQPNLHKRTASRFPGPSGNFRESPKQENRTEEKRTETNLTELKGGEGTGADGAPPAADGVDPHLRRATDFAEAWNRLTEPPIARCRDLTTKRKRHIRARLTERPLTEWEAVMGQIQASAFCRGENDRGWVASFDWLVGSPDVGVKVLEGKYADRAGKEPPFTKAELDRAATYRRNCWMGRCGHDPRCDSGGNCEAVLIRGWRSQGKVA